MNILLINDYLEGGGAEAVFREQFEILQKDFYTEMFYAFQTISDKAISPLSYIYSFHFKLRLNLVLRNRRFDCVIVHNYNSALSPSILDTLDQYKKKNACKIIHYAHDYHLVCPNRGYNYFVKGKRINFQKPPVFYDILSKKLDEKGAAYSLLKKLQWVFAYTLRHKQKVFDLILAPSDFLVRQIQFKYPKQDVQRMYNVCNSLNFAKPADLKEKHTTLRLVYFGRLDPAKGLVSFIEAIRNSPLDYFFTMIGEGEEFTNIQQCIERYGLQNRVALNPKLSQADLFAELSQYDVFVLPSLWYENAPLSIVEAASLGLGLFLSGHGGVLEIGEICKAVHFFNPFDPNDVASKLEVLYKDFISNSLPKADLEHLQILFSKETYIENLKKHLPMRNLKTTRREL